MTRIGHDQNRPMIRIGFYGTASDIAQWEESLAGRLPPFEIVELISDVGASCDVALVWAPPRDAFTRCPNLRGIMWSTPWPCIMMPRRFGQRVKASRGGAQTSATSQ